eukprot:7711735-Lingulodinium_polyedra.AAC.1
MGSIVDQVYLTEGAAQANVQGAMWFAGGASFSIPAITWVTPSRAPPWPSGGQDLLGRIQPL